MLKTIKKVLFLTSLISSSVFPMTRVAQALLIRRTLNQTTSFHSSLCVKCPILTTLIVEMFEDTTDDLENKQTSSKKSSSIKNKQQHVNLRSQFAAIDSQGAAIKNKKPHANSCPKHELNNWQNQSNDASKNCFPSDNAKEAAKLYSNLAFTLQQENFNEKNLAKTKSEVSDLTANFTMNVQNETQQLRTSYCSLSHDVILTKRKELTDRLDSLENDHKFLMQNSNVYYYTHDINQYGLSDEVRQYCNKSTWTIEDYEDISAALKIKVEIEATKLAIQECDSIIHKFEQESLDFSQTLKNASLNTLENEIMPDLVEKQKATREATGKLIAEKKHTRLQQNNELIAIDAQLKSFDKRSMWAKTKELITPDYTPDYLKSRREIVEEEIKETSKELQSLYDKNKEIDEQVEQAQKAIDKLKAEQSESQQTQVIKFSSQAQTLITNANVEFAGFEKLSPTDQQQVADLVNRAAQEQKTINNASYDEIITTTVQVADTACQAYQKGKTELGDALVNFGNTVLDCTQAFSKGLTHGVSKSVQSNLDAIMHPLDTLTSLAKGVVHAATKLLNHNDLLLSLATPSADSAITLGSSITSTLADVKQKLNDMSLVEIFEKLGEKTGEFGTDLLIFDGALKGASIVKNIVVAETLVVMKKAEQGLAAVGEIAKAEIAALTESAETLAKTAEGFDVAINAKRADIAKEAQALNSEANSFNKAKNTVKSESATVSASKSPFDFGPFGKYENNPKHHINAPKGIGKPLCDGQKALDKSIAVPGKDFRVGVENGKIVQFNQHRPNEFHGYIIENFKKLHPEAKNALYDAGIIRDITKGKIR